MKPQRTTSLPSLKGLTMKHQMTKNRRLPKDLMMILRIDEPPIADGPDGETPEDEPPVAEVAPRGQTKRHRKPRRTHLSQKGPMTKLPMTKSHRLRKGPTVRHRTRKPPVAEGPDHDGFDVDQFLADLGDHARGSLRQFRLRRLG